MPSEAGKRDHPTEGGSLATKRWSRRYCRVVVPPACRTAVFRMYHDRMAHFGVGRCFPLIAARYYWDTAKAMRKELGEYINRCAVCQRIKLLRHVPGAYQTDEVGNHPWDIVAMDEYDVGHAMHIDGYTNIFTKIKKYLSTVLQIKNIFELSCKKK